MKKLLDDPEKYYQPKIRPAGHDVGKAFSKDNSGSIPSNLLQIPNSESNGQYLSGCKVVSVKQRPARFPAKLPEFFIRFLSDPDDLVVDIFAGSNTTGQVAEVEGRRWLAFEKNIEYVAASAFRFPTKHERAEEMQRIYNQICDGKTVNLTEYQLNELPRTTAITKSEIHSQAS